MKSRSPLAFHLLAALFKRVAKSAGPPKEAKHPLDVLSTN